MRTKKKDPEDFTGPPDASELHPRIEHAYHLHDGHAVVRGTRLTVARVLRDLARHGLDVGSPDLMLFAVNRRIEPADIVGVLKYAADWMDAMPRLEAEIHRLHAALEAERKRK